MTARDFAFWLQGYFELQADSAQPISAPQADIIRRHLALVFKHDIDPSMGAPAHQVGLDKIHNGAFAVGPDPNVLFRC